jgi:hypothetical protein
LRPNLKHHTCDHPFSLGKLSWPLPSYSLRS